MRTYPVRVAHEGKWWVARATDFDHAVTQARRLSEVEAAAQDMIAAIADVEPGEVAVDLFYERVGDVDIVEVGHRVAAERESVEAAQRSYARRLEAEARRLSDNGLTVRDIGQVLSLSHQRAHQLLAGVNARATDTLAADTDRGPARTRGDE